MNMKLHEASELTSSVGETGLKDESCEQGEPQHEQPRRAKETPCNRADRSNEPQAPRQSRKSSQDERQKGETGQTSETSKSGRSVQEKPQRATQIQHSLLFSSRLFFPLVFLLSSLFSSLLFVTPREKTRSRKSWEFFSHA